MRFSRVLAGVIGGGLLLLIGLLSGPAGYGPGEPQGVEAVVLGEVKKLTASDAQANDNFGRSVAISGDTAVVAAIASDVMGGVTQSVYIFERDEGGMSSWGEVNILTASDADLKTVSVPAWRSAATP